MFRRLLFVILLTTSIVKVGYSQGIYAEFGQNRVQYRQFEWKKLSYENIDIDYYDDEELLAKNALETALEELNRIENFLSYKYGGAMQILVFQNLSDYRQSNIGYENPQHSAGGFLTVPKDVSTVYFNGDYNDLQKQLRKAICDIILREMIFGGTLQDRFSSVRSQQLPIWFTEGLSAFLAESWNAENENDLMDAFTTHGFSNFNNLSREEMALAGKSIWRYLVEEYGSESLATVVFISRYTHSAEAAIYFHTQKNIGEFLRDWRKFYKDCLFENISETLPRGTANVPKAIAKNIHTDLAISPDGQTIAIVTNDRGRFDIWKFFLPTGNVKHVYGGGQRVLNQVADFGFPKIKWNPVTKNLNFITYEKGIYHLKESKDGKIENKITFKNFTGINEFDFSADAQKIVFSAVSKGLADIYTMNADGSNIQQITNDAYYDHGAIFREDGSILFISNRSHPGDSMVAIIGPVSNLFLFKNGGITALTQYTNTVDLGSVISYNNAIAGFIADLSGINNAYVLNTDTAAQVYGQTNYKLGVLAQSISADKKTLAELLLIQGKYHIFTSSVPENPMSETVVIKYRNWKNTIGNLDSLFGERNVRQSDKLLEGQDSVQYAIFDSTGGQYQYQTGYPHIDYQNPTISDSSISFSSFKRSHFFNSLQPDYLLSQSENRLLGSYLQSNNIKREAIRNPLIMPYLKISLSDILKNYIVEAGFRSSLDLLITDYTARFGLLKYRTDHDFSISRHMRKYDEGDNVLKQHLSTQGNYTASYPIDEKNRISVGLGGRYEINSIKGSENNNLSIPDIQKYFVTSKLDYTYDNTRSLGLNMLSGLRGNIGMEYLKNPGGMAAIANLHADVRMYITVWRKVIWANRFSGVYSLGNGKVAYYLGAVENWTTKTQYAPLTPILNGEAYQFQMQVSNLRGFYRGIRMGSSFMLINSELRVPLIQTFVGKPVESEFFKNFTATCFADYGTAFIGKSPADPNNPFNTIYQNTPNYDLSITSQRNPYALGVGFGLRTRFLGYFIKYDHAWGYLERQWLTPINYFSLGFDF
ncbi:MAG: PD40 domain-containing protein [Bacteroidia bacterium]|nr:PD40 domain-containing protein [Bacteroidia bacterium]